MITHDFLYNAVGMLSSLMFLGCLFGLVKQYRRINSRKKDVPAGETGYATRSLSVNSFFSSFIAFYAFFLYSIMLQEIDYYLFVTRLLAASMTLVVLFEIFRDRKPLSQRLPFLSGVLLMAVAVLCIGVREDMLFIGRSASIFLAVGATLIMLQGGIQQIRKIRQEQSVGALSLSMNVIFAMKDVSNIAFGLVIGFADGWPLIMTGTVSALTKAAVIMQFYFFREKPVAA
ncbi:hypothetical protein [Aliamphritea hakodatensis]|uniref:hypothetical protein n=1 Tax=Aliamphritea hakodatensis TaxID=2895352 RepID=UPI0022FD9E55|nr:hypothetical protein [Aliamphritea hakodatensis]